MMFKRHPVSYLKYLVSENEGCILKDNALVARFGSSEGFLENFVHWH